MLLQTRKRLGHALAQARMKQQIFRRVTAQRQLLENHELCFVAIASLFNTLRNTLSIARDIPDNEIELCQCYS